MVEIAEIPPGRDQQRRELSRAPDLDLAAAENQRERERDDDDCEGEDKVGKGDERQPDAPRAEGPVRTMRQDERRDHHRERRQSEHRDHEQER